MKNTVSAIDPKVTASQITLNLESGMAEASRIYLQYILAGGDPQALRRHLDVSNECWEFIDACAAKRVVPSAWYMIPSVRNHFRKLPYDIQVQVIGCRYVNVLSAENKMIRTKVFDLTASQAYLVFSEKGLNTKEEQRDIRDKLPTGVPPGERPAWEFLFKPLRVKVNRMLSLRDADIMLKQMHAQAE